MAIIRSLAIGKAVNSAGNLTYQTIKGRTIAREKPTIVRNPNTPAQRAQRSKMRNAVAFYRWFGIAVKWLFTQTTKYGSQYNEFVRRNLELATEFNVDEETGKVVPVEGAVFSAGVYPTASLLEKMGSTADWAVTITNEQLRQELALGDQIIQVGYREDGTYEVVSHMLTEDDINTLKAGNAYEFDSIDGGIFRGLAWYSSASNRSSTGVLVQ